MAATAPPHPCDRGKAFEPWRADHLYIGDNGEILCGRCMGTESTYVPHAWSDLGEMGADRTVVLSPMWIEMGPGQKVLQGATSYRCETDKYAKH